MNEIIDQPFIAGLFAVVTFIMMAYRKSIMLFLALILISAYALTHIVQILAWPLNTKTFADFVPWLIAVFGDVWQSFHAFRFAILIGLLAGLTYRQYRRRSLL